MKRISIIMLGMSIFSFADFLGGEATITGMKSEVSEYKINNTDKNSLSMDKMNYGASLSFEHPIPIIPNVKLSYLNLSALDKSEISGEPINSDININNYDGTIYYEFLDNWISLDLGITARKIEGQFYSEVNSKKYKNDIDLILPMIYGKVSFELPFSSYSALAEGNYLNLDNNKMYDISLGVRKEISLGLCLEAGYKKNSIDIKIDENKMNLNIDNIYGKVIFDF